MEEEILFKAKPSVLLYWPRFLLYILLALSWLPLPDQIVTARIILNIHFWQISSLLSLLIIIIGFADYLKLICTRYEITNERIFIYSGILNRKRDEVEFYRIKDYQVLAPIHIRLFGLGNIRFDTSDHTTPVFNLFALKNSYKLADILREKVEQQRKIKGVREFD